MLLYLAFEFIYCVCFTRARACVYVPLHMYAGQRTTCRRLFSSSIWGFRRSDSGHQIWWQVPLAAKPSCQSRYFFLLPALPPICPFQTKFCHQYRFSKFLSVCIISYSKEMFLCSEINQTFNYTFICYAAKTLISLGVLDLCFSGACISD